MWQLSQPWWEFIARGAIIYVFVFFILRAVGKRQISQLSSFDFVLLLIISNAVQNSMNAGDNTVTAGLILSTTLVLLNLGVTTLVYKSKKFEKLIEGSPTVLVHDGKVDKNALDKEKLSHHDLELALRKEGVAEIKNVRFAILEANGQITVIQKK